MTSEAFTKLKARLDQVRPTGPLDVAARRAAMEAVAFPPAPDVTVVETTVGPLHALSVTAPEAAAERTLLFLHGGGYAMGSPRTHVKLAGDLSRASGARVLLVDYPLAPEAPFPAAIDAICESYAHLAASGEAIAVAGDSAGGGLALALLVAARDRGLPTPRAGVLISPWADLTFSRTASDELIAADPMVNPPDLHAMRTLYLGDNDPTQALASPALADLTGLPPLLIHVGGAEVLLGDAELIAERAAAAGVKTELEVWAEMVHVWHVFAGRVPEATAAVDAIGQFLARHLS